MSVFEWGTLYWKWIFKDWGTPSRLISDRDPTFNSDFWRTVFRRQGTLFGITTAYHPAADGQAERSNQNIATALRYILMSKYEETWNNLLPHVKYVLNISINASINAPTNSATSSSTSSPRQPARPPARSSIGFRC